MHDGRDGSVDVMPDCRGGARDREGGRPVLSAQRRVPTTSDARHGSGGGRRPDGTDGEAARRRHGGADAGRCDGETGGVRTAGRGRDDQRRFGG
jgi:hypothetical protein